ncbi:MAG: monovalent cation:proton antiporter family protein [Candidatus Abyssubacteria bacterium]
MDFWSTVLDLFMLLIVALVTGALFERLKQSAVLGYLVAGTAIGPGAFNLINNKEAVSSMAELGVALLLFTIGLEFSWSRLRKVGPFALGGGTLQILLTGALTAAIALALGMSLRPAVALGAMLAPSSTACVLRILADRAETESVYGRNALGVLLLQDVALVPLVLLVSMLGGGDSLEVVLLGIGKALFLAVALIAVFYLLNRFLLPRLLDLAVATGNRELPTLLATAVFLGAIWTTHALELSPALGAFVAGFLLGESPFATQIRADVGVLRTLFVATFFASIGMLADLPFVASQWLGVLGFVAAIVAGKALIIWPIGLLFRHSHRHSLATGVSLAQVGEFSFVLAQIGVARGVVSDDLFRLILTATVATLFLTPYLVAVAPHVGEWTERTLFRASARRGFDAEKPSEKLAAHVIVVGYGPAGQGVVEALARANIPAIVLELNSRTVFAARQRGVRAEVGDATQDGVLDHLQVVSARAVVVTVPDHRTALQTICQVRSLAPNALVIARSRYHIYARDLELAGAHSVIDEERQIGHILGTEVIRRIQPESAAPQEFPPLL